MNKMMKNFERRGFLPNFFGERSVFLARAGHEFSEILFIVNQNKLARSRQAILTIFVSVSEGLGDGIWTVHIKLKEVSDISTL